MSAEYSYQYWKDLVSYAPRNSNINGELFIGHINGSNDSSNDIDVVDDINNVDISDITLHNAIIFGDDETDQQQYTASTVDKQLFELFNGIDHGSTSTAKSAAKKQKNKKGGASNTASKDCDNIESDNEILYGCPRAHSSDDESSENISEDSNEDINEDINEDSNEDSNDLNNVMRESVETIVADDNTSNLDNESDVNISNLLIN